LVAADLHLARGEVVLAEALLEDFERRFEDFPAADYFHAEAARLGGNLPEALRLLGLAAAHPALGKAARHRAEFLSASPQPR
jgi:hypothetical protein